MKMLSGGRAWVFMTLAALLVALPTNAARAARPKLKPVQSSAGSLVVSDDAASFESRPDVSYADAPDAGSDTDDENSAPHVDPLGSEPRGVSHAAQQELTEDFNEPRDFTDREDVRGRILVSPPSSAEEEMIYPTTGAYPPIGHIMPTIGVPNMRPGWQFHGGLLYLQPSADNLGWGILTNELNDSSPVPIASPYWTVESLTPGYSPGVEVGGGYTFAGTGRDVQLNYQHLRTNTTDAAATNASGEWISPFSQTGPPTADSFDEIYNLTGVGDLQSGDAQVKFAYDSVNLDFGQYVNIGEALMFRLFAGVSYARLQERLYSNFYGVPPASTEPFPDNVPLRISLDNTTNFWGVGPRFGFDSSYQTRCGLRFTGQLAGALLVGQTQPAQYVFTATAPELAAVGISENYEQIGSQAFSHVVWATNAKLGIAYTRELASGHVLTVETGYLAAIYLNPFSGNETNENILGLDIGSLSSGSIRHIQQSNFSLNGFYLNAGVNW